MSDEYGNATTPAAVAELGRQLWAVARATFWVGVGMGLQWLR
jgi:hypothetical protein